MYLFDEFQTSRPAFSRRPRIKNLYDVFRYQGARVGERTRCLCRFEPGCRFLRCGVGESKASGERMAKSFMMCEMSGRLCE